MFGIMNQACSVDQMRLSLIGANVIKSQIVFDLYRSIC